MFTRDALPSVGHVLTTLNGQDYRLEAVTPHKSSFILKWSTPCRDCGSTTECTSPVSFPMKALRGRCEPCMMADYGCSGAARAEVVKARYGAAQAASHAEARHVRTGRAALRPRHLTGISLNAAGDGLRCEFSFNDRKKRAAFYRDGEVRCSEAKGCDFSPFVATLEKLLNAEIARSLF